MTQAARLSGIRRWTLMVLGILSVLLGGILVVNPLASLAALVLVVAVGCLASGLADLVSRDDGRRSLVSGVLWLAAGVAVLAWPGLTIRGLAALLGGALVVGGVLRLVGGVRGTRDERVAAVLLGAAGVTLGVLALAWPDVTVLVLAVVFGIRLLVAGAGFIVSAARGRRSTGTPQGLPGRRPWWRRWLATAGAGAALLVALALVAVSLSLQRDAPRADAFYDAPEDLPGQPGRLLRAEAFDRGVPDGAEAWRLLYTSTDAAGGQVTASAIVVAPADRSEGPLPVVAWAHGTTGVARGCAPSVLEEPFQAGATPALGRVVGNGWVMVATDYQGLGSEGEHLYLVGEPAGRAVLDAVRAARQLDDLDLADRTVVWGHSQGGHSALWTGILAPDYAPDVEVAGVVAMAPASNLPGLVENLDSVPGGVLFASYVMEGYSDAYEDVTYADYVRAPARVLVREMAARCLAEKSALVSVVESLLLDRSVLGRSPTEGPFGARLEENVPRGAIPAPLLLAQGEADQLVLPEAQASYVAARCAEHGNLDYRTYAGRDHVPLVEDDSPLIPELLSWTQDRFDGVEFVPTCG